MAQLTSTSIMCQRILGIIDDANIENAYSYLSEDYLATFREELISLKKDLSVHDYWYLEDLVPKITILSREEILMRYRLYGDQDTFDRIFNFIVRLYTIIILGPFRKIFHADDHLPERQYIRENTNILEFILAEIKRHQAPNP